MTGTVDQTPTVKSTARFKPYGAELATTGTTPSYGYTGNTGSRRTTRPHTDIYNQARHLGTIEGRWTTADPLWPWESSYTYVNSQPTTRSDPSGFGRAHCGGTIESLVANKVISDLAVGIPCNLLPTPCLITKYVTGQYSSSNSTPCAPGCPCNIVSDRTIEETKLIIFTGK